MDIFEIGLWRVWNSFLLANTSFHAEPKGVRIVVFHFGQKIQGVSSDKFEHISKREWKQMKMALIKPCILYGVKPRSLRLIEPMLAVKNQHFHLEHYNRLQCTCGKIQQKWHFMLNNRILKHIFQKFCDHSKVDLWKNIIHNYICETFDYVEVCDMKLLILIHQSTNMLLL